MQRFARKHTPVLSGWMDRRGSSRVMDCCTAPTSLLFGSVRRIAYRPSKSGGAREIESRWWKAIGKKRMARWHLSIWAAFEARIMKRRLAAQHHPHAVVRPTPKKGAKREEMPTRGRRAKASQPDGLMNGRAKERLLNNFPRKGGEDSNFPD